MCILDRYVVVAIACATFAIVWRRRVECIYYPCTHAHTQKKKKIYTCYKRFVVVTRRFVTKCTSLKISLIHLIHAPCNLFLVGWGAPLEKIPFLLVVNWFMQGRLIFWKVQFSLILPHPIQFNSMLPHPTQFSSNVVKGKTGHSIEV